MTSFDAIIVGGGHNGLACATLLAKSGRKVLVLEAAGEAGGAARADEFAPGFRTSLAPLLNRLHGETIAALDLKAHGLDLAGPDMPTAVLSPGVEPLVLRGAYGETIDGLSESEAAAWRELRAQLLRFAGILRPFLFRPPPDLGGGTLVEKAALGGAALALRRLGKEDMRDFLRLLLTNVADLADDCLSDDRLKGMLSFDAVLGSRLGPRSPTSLMGLYYRLAGDIDGTSGSQCLPRGGMAAIIAAMLRAAESAGVVLRRNSRVERIRVEDGRASGVIVDGEQIAAPLIVSAANPRTTFLDLIGARHLDTGFATRLKHVRMTGHVARLDLALDGMPEFAGLAAVDHNARIVAAPSIDHVERAFNPVKYDELPDAPVMEIVLPSAGDPSLAPPGGAVLSASIQFVPVDPKGGWAGAREPFQTRIMAQLEALAPGIGRMVRHARLSTPQDIELSHLIPGGHWHHGELQVDQMLVNRPLFGAARYDTPIDGLYLAGAGSHPGGGISGAPGLNAARRIIAMEKRS